ncbi:MAG: FAD-dependent oxidoreductase [Desulfobacteraceae bacterium]|nr:FAD-dependent oxidoreductase [Desulfobacteraceae bacterium]
MKNNDKKVVIVGAGVAGLTLAYKLSHDQDKEVLLIEKEPFVGGLARSFEYGDYTFDIGPHRFHTDLPDILSFIDEILGGNYLSIERKSSVWMYDKYFEWPLKIDSILRMPIDIILSAGLDFLVGRRKSQENFEDYVISRYGKTLYRTFFKPYTEKFLKISCSEISRDWAVTGVERAVIDNKIKIDSLFSLLKSLLNPAKPLEFIYPKDGGIRVFAENLKEKFVDNGGAISLNTKVDEIVKDGKRIKGVVVGGKYHECDLLVWTGPISQLFALLGMGKTGLEYISLILFNYKIDHAPLMDSQWCYYGSEEVPFNRISIPSLFNPALAPPGKSGLCVEVTSREDEDLWKNPSALDPELRRSLKKFGVIKDEKDVIDVHIERISNAYPVYKLDYQEKQKMAFEMLREFENIRLLGRTATFWYNNMDHSIGAALDLCKKM